MVSVNTLGAIHNDESSSAKMTPLTVIILADVNFSINQLETGKPATNPAGKANNTPPQRESDNKNFS